MSWPARLWTSSLKRSVGIAVYSRRAASRTAKPSSGRGPRSIDMRTGPPRARREVRHARVDRFALLGVDPGGGLRRPASVGQVPGLALVVAGAVALLDAGRVPELVRLHVRLPALHPVGHAASFARRLRSSKKLPMRSQTSLPPVSPRQPVRMRPTSA